MVVPVLYLKLKLVEVRESLRYYLAGPPPNGDMAHEAYLAEFDQLLDEEEDLRRELKERLS